MAASAQTPGPTAEDTSVPALLPLRKVIDLNSLEAPGKPPFHLKMTFELNDLDGKPQEQGTLEYWWAGPAESALTITSPSLGTGIDLSDAVVGDTAQRSLYLIRQLLEAIQSPSIPIRKEDTRLVTLPTVDGKLKLNCLHAESAKDNPSAGHDLLCVDESNGTIRSIRAGTQILLRDRLASFGGTRVALDDYLAECGKVAAHGTVTTLQGFDPAKGAVTLTRSERQNDSKAGAVPGQVIAGSLTRRVQPIYPDGAKMRRISGSVLLHIRINTAGTVGDVFPIASSDPQFTAAAIDAVKQWVYRPYLLNGVPTVVNTVVTVNFNLNGPG